MSVIILPFGAPRSGTTFLDRALHQIKGAVVSRFREPMFFHPAKSKTGMLGLAQVFAEHHLVFVRIVRHPIEVAESFVAARTVLKLSDGLARNSDKSIVEWIACEAENFWAQMRFMRNPEGGWAKVPWRVVQVRFEDLGSPAGRASFVWWLRDALPSGFDLKPVVRYIEKNWGKPERAVRPGRLSAGVQESVLTPEQRKFFERELAWTAELNGYDIKQRPERTYG